MTRTLFPYDDDRHVIREFLHGRDAASDYLEAKTANGSQALVLGSTVIAFIDGAGALTVIPSGPHGYAPLDRRALNAMLELIQHEHQLDRNVDEVGMNPVTTLDGVELTPGVPMTVLGPLGLRAWREANP